MVDPQFKKFIVSLSNRIYEQLGASHSESIYQKALQAELHTQGLIVDTEYHISVEYQDTQGRKHKLASERIDIFIHKNPDSPLADIQKSDIILELKAISKVPGISETEQVRKYLRQFKKQGIDIPYGIVINFPQPTASGVSDAVQSLIVQLQ